MARKPASKARTAKQPPRDKRKPEWSIVTYEELEAWRAGQEIPKKRLAHLLGVTNSTWHNWARGKAVATPTTQRRIRAVIDGKSPEVTLAASAPLRRPLRDGRLPGVTGPGGGDARAAAAASATGAIVSAWIQAGKSQPDAERVVQLLRSVLRALEG